MAFKVVYDDDSEIDETEVDWKDIDKTRIKELHIIDRLRKKETKLTKTKIANALKYLELDAEEGFNQRYFQHKENGPEGLKQVIGLIVNSKGDCLLYEQNLRNEKIARRRGNIFKMKLNLEAHGLTDLAKA